eukprot:COSAG06_NODE_75356_length_132_cov_16.030303_1_plen_22_part_10
MVLLLLLRSCVAGLLLCLAIPH